MEHSNIVPYEMFTAEQAKRRRARALALPAVIIHPGTDFSGMGDFRLVDDRSPNFKNFGHKPPAPSIHNSGPLPEDDFPVPSDYDAST